MTERKKDREGRVKGEREIGEMTEMKNVFACL